MNTRCYKTVYFDIVGHCNALCPYCHSGINRIGSGGNISVDLFRKVLTKVLLEEIIRTKTVISLYNWGEPILHPKLNDIITCINTLDLKYALSTNASLLPQIDHNFAQNLRYIIFSVSGFSQASYNKIHGLKFETVKQNIISIVNACRKYNTKTSFLISYHVYRFNVDEIYECEEFANEHGIIFKPIYAILNHWWMLKDFITDRMSSEEKNKIINYLYNTEKIKAQIRKFPKDYSCPQLKYLNIDENGNVITCCQLAGNHKDYICGNIVEEDMDSILTKKENRQVCRECLASGLAYYLNHSIFVLPFYRRSSVQKTLLFKERVKKISEFFEHVN